MRNWRLSAALKALFIGRARDLSEEIINLAPEITARFPDAVFFGGQLVFEDETFISRWLHNYTVFALQRRFYLLGLPFVTLPIRVSDQPSAAVTDPLQTA